MLLMGKWSLVDVAAVFGLRLALLFVLERTVLPWVRGAVYLRLQVTDSILLIILVFLFLVRRKVPITSLFTTKKLSFQGQLLGGAAAGLFLLFIGTMLEEWTGRFLVSQATAHPLLQLGQEAGTAGEFVNPFLAGTFLVPVAEEFFYRGFLFPPLAAKAGEGAAVILAALLFTLAHWDQVWLGEIMLVGIGLTWLFQRTRSLLPSILAHAILNGERLIMFYLML